MPTKNACFNNNFRFFSYCRFFAQRILIKCLQTVRDSKRIRRWQGAQSREEEAVWVVNEASVSLEKLGGEKESEFVRGVQIAKCMELLQKYKFCLDEVLRDPSMVSIDGSYWEIVQVLLSDHSQRSIAKEKSSRKIFNLLLPFRPLFSSSWRFFSSTWRFIDHIITWQDKSKLTTFYN